MNHPRRIVCIKSIICRTLEDIRDGAAEQDTVDLVVDIIRVAPDTIGKLAG